MVITRAFKAVRNHWKKTIFFSICGAYGVRFLDKWRRENELLREYCQEASKYGNQRLTARERPRKVMIFLNPAAKDGKTKYLLDNYVLPMLHLAGLEVNIVRTEHEGQAKSYMSVLDTNIVDSILVAGGDGTLSEVVTGLLRRDDNLAQKIPIGVLPFGQTSSIASRLFPISGDLEVESYFKSCMALIKNSYSSMDVIEVRPDTTDGKPVYILDHLYWGSYSELNVRKTKYWYLPGPLKSYYAYAKQALFKSFPPSLTVHLESSPPCIGCSTCNYREKPADKPTVPTGVKRSWLTSWLYTNKTSSSQIQMINKSGVNYSGGGAAAATKPQLETQQSPLSEIGSCDQMTSSEVTVSQLRVNRRERQQEQLGMKTVLELSTSEPPDSRYKFLTQPETQDNIIEIGSVKITPEPECTEPWFIMDSEKFEVKPLTLRLLKSRIKIYS